jgi:hypothetical protein
VTVTPTSHTQKIAANTPLYATARQLRNNSTAA